MAHHASWWPTVCAATKTTQFHCTASIVLTLKIQRQARTVYRPTQYVDHIITRRTIGKRTHFICLTYSFYSGRNSCFYFGRVLCKIATSQIDGYGKWSKNTHHLFCLFLISSSDTNSNWSHTIPITSRQMSKIWSTGNHRPVSVSKIHVWAFKVRTADNATIHQSVSMVVI